MSQPDVSWTKSTPQFNNSQSPVKQDEGIMINSPGKDVGKSFSPLPPPEEHE
jgi:hypothetical protein